VDIPPESLSTPQRLSIEARLRKWRLIQSFWQSMWKSILR
jgi:hypothetical protein